MNYIWFTKEFCDKVAPILKQSPYAGRVVLEQEAGISKWQAEKFLEEYRRLGLISLVTSTYNAEALSERLWNTLSYSSETVKEAEPDVEEKPVGYRYIKGADVYVTKMTIDGESLLQNIDGEDHRAMLKDYSDWNGDKHTMEVFLAKHGIEKSWFEQYKRIHGWTRDTVPVTKEQLQTETEEVLSDALLFTKRETVLRKMEEKTANADKEDAEKWRNLENSLLEPLQKLAETKQKALHPPVNFSWATMSMNYELVLGAVDLHYGKYGWASEVSDGYSRDIAAKRLEETTHELLRRVLKHGMPDKVIIPAANDWLHIDNYQGMTTKGTPQDLDGTPAQILSEGFDLFTHYVTMVKQVVPNVEVLFIPDNHSKLLGLALMKYTQAYFRLDEDVAVDVNPFPRKYRMVGNTLCAFEHDLRKETPSQMAGEAAQLWGRSKYRVAFGAHLHHESLYASDKNGVLLYQLPTISGDDRWHTDQGYTLSRKALGGYLIDYEEGVVSTMYAPVK